MRILRLRRLNGSGKRMIERAKLSAEGVSHEMRAPLASIIMIIDSLLGGGSMPVQKKSQRKYLE